MASSTPSDAVVDKRALRWRSHPLMEGFRRSVLLIAVMLAVIASVHVGFGGLGYALLAAVFLAVSLSSYFLPAWYELDGDGAALRFLGRTRRLAWRDVRRVDVRKDGVHLSPFDAPSRLDPFRGLFLRFSGNADEVVSFVESQVAAHG